MTELLDITERYIVDTEEKAEALVTKIKEENIGNVKQSSINKKVKKELEYFIVTIKVEHGSEKELFEMM